MSYSIYLTTGQLVAGGPKGNSYTEDQAQSSVDDRNARAEQLGIEARYKVGPTKR